MTERSQVFVVTLRRSGSTIFWETLRQDSSFLAFNEPFNPSIRRLGDPRWIEPNRRHYSEYEQLLERDGARFWDHFEAIHDVQELQEGLSPKEMDRRLKQANRAGDIGAHAMAIYLAERNTPPDAAQQALREETEKLEHWGMRFNHEAAVMLQLIVVAARPQYVVEVGTFTGYSSLTIARVSSAFEVVPPLASRRSSR